MHRHRREENAQQGRRDDADEDRLLALRRIETCGGKADDDGIVAGKNQVDCDNLQERRQTGSCQNFHASHLPIREAETGRPLPV